MRQQFVDPAGRVRLHAHEHVGQVVDRVDAEFLARRNEGVEHREVVTSFFVAGAVRKLPFCTQSPCVRELLCLTSQA